MKPPFRSVLILAVIPAPIRLVALIALAFSGLVGRSAAADKNDIPASDARFLYEGRLDTSDPAAPVVVWQASRIRIDFDGDALALRFSNLDGQVFFDATIDGRTSLVSLRTGQPPAGVSFSQLGAGRHRLVLFKRSEAAAGHVAFRGIRLAAGAQAYAPPTPRYKHRFLFIGDSITVGACNEDGPEDQWDDRATHNAAKSYAALTAAAFDADHRNIAVSGMGVSTGWVPMKAENIWDRRYPQESSPRSNLSFWQPDVVFLNFGENDDSFTRAKDLPFPSDYADRYVALVHAIRRTWPNAEIVILRGGMFGGAQSPRLRGPWSEAVVRLEKNLPRVTHFAFQHWSHNHPRVADDRAMADELIDWLNRQRFMSK